MQARPPASTSSLGRRLPRRSNVAVCCSAHELPAPSRRELLGLAIGLALAPAGWAAQHVSPAIAEEPATLSKFEPMEALKDKDYGKSRMRYSDFIATPSGLQYKDLREGTGEQAKIGDVAVIDWDGYTIGYYGRPFEARNKPKGSSFNDDNKDYVRYKLGSNAFIPAFEEAITGMKVGGVRRIVVPVEIGYPEKDWRSKGPKPSTFSGDRALDFVLSNRGMIDKTLLFTIELKNILKDSK